MVSARLREEQRRLEPPYFALSFDQHADKQIKNPISVTMGHFETMEHISQFGRPLYVLSPKLRGQLLTRLR